MGVKDKVKTAVDGSGTVGRLLGSKKRKAAAAGVLAEVIVALAESTWYFSREFQEKRIMKYSQC